MKSLFKGGGANLSKIQLIDQKKIEKMAKNWYSNLIAN